MAPLRCWFERTFNEKTTVKLNEGETARDQRSPPDVRDAPTLVYFQSGGLPVKAGFACIENLSSVEVVLGKSPALGPVLADSIRVSRLVV